MAAGRAPRCPLPARGQGAGPGLLMMLGGLVVVGYALRFLWRAWRTGTVPGRLGAIYTSDNWHFTTTVIAAVVGLGLGLACLRLGWRWLQNR